MKVGSVVAIRFPNWSDIILGQVVYLNAQYANVATMNGPVRAYPRYILCPVCGDMKDKFLKTMTPRRPPTLA
jgi:rubredoxin